MEVRPYGKHIGIVLFVQLAVLEGSRITLGGEEALIPAPLVVLGQFNWDIRQSSL